ncbi:MAG TPA: hypothetical protein VM681_11375 [Candidatus Thermoplasmatota archaeon]|nr:hypothetical protein [Candidatus Thermoplasmatota archaeon]
MRTVRMCCGRCGEMVGQGAGTIVECYRCRQRFAGGVVSQAYGARIGLFDGLPLGAHA